MRPLLKAFWGKKKPQNPEQLMALGLYLHDKHLKLKNHEALRSNPHYYDMGQSPRRFVDEARRLLTVFADVAVSEANQSWQDGALGTLLERTKPKSWWDKQGEYILGSFITAVVIALLVVLIQTYGLPAVRNLLPDGQPAAHALAAPNQHT
jgi:hypothetical protein